MPISFAELDLDFATPELFLVVRCSFLNKLGHKDAFQQEIPLPTVIWHSTAERDEPARTLWKTYQGDRRVAWYHQHKGGMVLARTPLVATTAPTATVGITATPSEVPAVDQ